LPHTVTYKVSELSIKDALNEAVSESDDSCIIWWKVAEAGRRTVMCTLMKPVVMLLDMVNVTETVDK
jgi:hypothetical protein